VAARAAKRNPRPPDGNWYAGELQAWRKDDDGAWLAFVLYGVAPGIRYLEWTEAERVRPAQSRTVPTRT
jgi:hypothetical protein